jgi:uncharacterized protein
VAEDRYWEDKPLSALNRDQWESLCDGCGLCCVHKLEDEETGELYPTNVACRLLNRRTAKCQNYRNRHAYVPDCMRLTPAKLAEADWLPETCAYVRRAAGKPLPEWHYLVCGDPEAVHTAGVSVRGWTVSEDDVDRLEDHIIPPRS